MIRIWQALNHYSIVETIQRIIAYPCQQAFYQRHPSSKAHLPELFGKPHQYQPRNNGELFYHASASLHSNTLPEIVLRIFLQAIYHYLTIIHIHTPFEYVLSRGYSYHHGHAPNQPGCPTTVPNRSESNQV